MRSRRPTKPVAFLGLAMLALGLAAVQPQVSRADDTPWLGVTLQALTDGLRDGMGYDGQGVLVNRVLEGSPADRAGLRKGDVIVSLNGRSADSPEQLTRLVRDSRVGQTVSLTIVRDGDRRTLSARLGNRPDDADLPGGGGTGLRSRDDQGEPDHGDMDQPDMDDHGDAHKDMKELKGLGDKDLEDMRGLEDMPGMDGRTLTMMMGRGRLGVRTEDLSSDLAPYFDAPAGSGALVMEVLKDTPAERAGLRAGDVIVRVGDERITSADDLISTIRRAPEGRIRVTVLRHGQRRTREPELEATPRWEGPRRGTMLGPGGGRMILRDRNGTRVNRGDADRDEELQRLRDEVRRLRQELNDQRDRRDKDDQDEDGNN